MSSPMKGGICRPFRPLKYSSVALFMLCSILLLLLYKVNIDWMSFKPTNKVCSTATVKLTAQPVSTCSFDSLSPEELLVFDSLRHVILWPETPSLKSDFSLNDTSDPRQSSFTILPRSGGGSWRVGDQLQVSIRIRDFHGRPKMSGGDVLLARLHNSTFHAGVAGHVVDHRNGSYSAFFSLLWEGRAQVEVVLVHPSEAVTVLQKLTEEQPGRIYFQSLFRSGSVSETTTCNLCLTGTQQSFCNYTDLRTGEPWFCFKPHKLDCDARISHAKGGFRKNLKSTEEKLFQCGVNMKVSIPASGPENINVLPNSKDGNEMTFKVRPSGYYYKGAWQALDGSRVHQFNSSAISQCLKGKAVHIYGDSTVRQWYEYLTNSLPDLKEFDLKTPKQSGLLMALDYVNKILVTFRSHGPPIRFANLPVSQLHYVVSELDSVIGGTNTVVVIGVWSHFSTFPVEVYVRRLLNIRKAVARLLSRAPGTTVVIRTANPKEMTLYESLTNSDWFSLQRDKMLREIFRKTNVKLVDAWEMIVAHHLPHKLHPESDIVKNMIDVLLSFVCPVADFEDFSSVSRS
ncbi:NXPE family member 3-like isoform X2 [Poecilia reticulata]|uniref:Neurexophilin and PC-esterase domain family member 3 n=2 Tax=Poecilia reticulata TaxID=8081 RepID=A0A3P9PHW6_POERE|nr:PREDICTED: NXPE family member 3-like isoform X2 [Poecilia reticulata]XP_008399530.1 PREDICTED: NXPE family member 3-like isoform X2 [Poecilia reticulata]XP_008399531.1 PREDICTED: NXPE family member 3-like isoform X2 [Poecilia reticulata]XP_008399532.1 PREDICTED: NXPE family member 3-like isoform X2 [Poecilia reticulata]XP_008399533.1 PREDICTED: NXPE family member 3-like isoform X2 [Poecilia reticulata]XP_017158191.1 PREDICTED: NXPE family member 3-like isoform X2 [Poecilia reticulata]